MISCSKQPQTFSLDLSMVLSICVSHVLYHFNQQPDSRILESSSLNFILFEPREIWTQLRNKQEKACSHLCYVNFLALIVWRIFSDFEHYSSNKKCYCYEWKRARQSGWQLPVEAVLDSIVYLTGIAILQTKQRYREVTNINISWRIQYVNHFCTLFNSFLRQDNPVF